MSTSRLAALPIDYLVAEMAAFPLASEAALRLRIVALDAELDPEFPYGTRLWREAEREVLGSFPAFSVDEAVAIRDRIWFAGHTRSAVPLHCYLRGLARLFFEAHGPVARPRSPDDAGPRGSKIPGLAAPDPEPREGRARWAWRWQSLALPPDLLLAGLAGDAGHRRTSISSRRPSGRSLRTLGAVVAASLHACIDDLLAGRLGGPVPGFADLRGLYLALTGGRLGSKDTRGSRRGTPGRSDCRIFPPAPPATAEMRLVASALRYLDEVPKDHDFALLFWQVVRVRALYYRHVVQRPMTAGLQWFIRFYSRIKPARRPIDKLGLASAVRLGGVGEGLCSLEFRTGPEKKISKLRRFVGGAHGAAKRGNHTSHECHDQRLPLARMECAAKPVDESPSTVLELGLVFHFTKDRGGGARDGVPQAHRRISHWDPNDNPTGYRFARFYNGWRRETLALRWMIWHYPRSLVLIRGIDVATDELGVPTWVLAPLFRYLRALSESAASRAPDGPGTLVPLRCTAHAGEDFVHLLTGLRNVEEAVRRLGFRGGDRIGHGLSLGVDARDWCRRTGPVPIAVEERLLDIVWEWTWYGREGQDPPASRASFLDREIARLSVKVFGKPVSPYDLEHFVECLYDEGVLRQMEFPNGCPPKGKLASRSLKLLRDYLKDLFERGQETEWIDPSAEGEALANLQSGVRRRLGQIGIAVEANPTSNLLIGDLGDLSKHPLWRLRPPAGMGDAPPVSVCIGSDDPLTFATDLRAEYQLVHDTLVLAGRSEAEAGEWIDAARKTGLDYRFTVPWQSLPPDVWKAHRANPAPFPLHPLEPP